MKLSQVALQLTPSEPRKIFEEAKKYNDVVDLTLGDPDLPPPENVREAGCRAILEGKTRYSANAGMPILREAIAADALAEYGMCFDPKNEIIVTVGAMESAYLALWSLLDPGDEAIIPAPFWINYREVVLSRGAIPVFVNTRPENNFVLDPEDVEKAITPRTKLLVLNSPSNPSGAVMPGEVLDRLAELVLAHDLMVVSDEIYSHLVYDGKKAESILTRPGMRERTCVINGCSKRFCMTGWRVGWSLAPAELVSVMTQMTENIVACAPLPSQYAALEALSSRTENSYILEEFQKRRNCVLEELQTIPQLHCHGIPATFYTLLDVSKTGMTGKEFVMSLLKEKQVAMVYGDAYSGGSDAYRDFVRLAFTMECPKIREAFRRIREFLQEHCAK